MPKLKLPVARRRSAVSCAATGSGAPASADGLLLVRFARLGWYVLLVVGSRHRQVPPARANLFCFCFPVDVDEGAEDLINLSSLAPCFFFKCL